MTCKLQNDIILFDGCIENYKIIGLEEKLNPFTALRQYAREILEELGVRNGK